MMTTLRENASNVPTSSGVPARTERPSTPSVAPLAVMTDPNALNKMLGSDRPMARLIIRVSKIPDAPTNVPATTKTFELRVNPDAATAMPVNELSSEMSTGTSAPPIGSTKITPSTRARASNTHKRAVDDVTKIAMTMPSADRPTTALMSCWAGYVTGRVVMSSWSLTKASAEPANDTAPTKTPNTTSRTL